MWSSFLYVYTLNCTDTSYCNSQSFRSNTRRNLFSIHRSLVASKKEDLKWAGSQDTCNTSKSGPETVDAGRKAGPKIHILKSSQLPGIGFATSFSMEVDRYRVIKTTSSGEKPDCLKIWLGKNLGLPCAWAQSCSRSRHFLQRYSYKKRTFSLNAFHISHRNFRMAQNSETIFDWFRNGNYILLCLVNQTRSTNSRPWQDLMIS